MVHRYVHAMYTVCASVYYAFVGPREDTHTTHLKWEVGVELIVVEDITDHLVQHGEQRAKGSQTSKVHDVIQALSVLEAA